MHPHLLIIPIGITLLGASCGKAPPTNLPVINTPPGAKVNLAHVSMVISNATITRANNNKLTLSFDYTVNNASGSHIAFSCLYNEMDDLIQANLHDKENKPLVLGKRPLEGLTLTEPRTLRIPAGETTRHYTAPLMPALQKKGDPISIRVRLHAPSRYDELRSSLEAPRTHIPWP